LHLIPQRCPIYSDRRTTSVVYEAILCQCSWHASGSETTLQTLPRATSPSSPSLFTIQIINNHSLRCQDIEVLRRLGVFVMGTAKTLCKSRLLGARAIETHDTKQTSQRLSHVRGLYETALSLSEVPHDASRRPSLVSNRNKPGSRVMATLQAWTFVEAVRTLHRIQILRLADRGCALED